MKNPHRVVVIATVVALSTVLLVPAVFAQAQTLTPDEQAARTRAIAQARANGRLLTVFDRDGKVLNTVGERDLYNQPSLSPDGNRIVVIKQDPEKETAEVWVMDVATGKGIQITSSQPREPTQAPVWSPDGSHVAYVAQRAGFMGLYRKASNGEGTEELLYRHTGGPIILTDWSLDGRFLNFSSNDLSGGILWALPLTGDRKPVIVSRSEKEMLAPRLSPDSRFVAYRSNESGRNEVWVRAFDPSGNPNAAPAGKWQVSDQGGLGMVSWRRGGKVRFTIINGPLHLGCGRKDRHGMSQL